MEILRFVVVSVLVGMYAFSDLGKDYDFGQDVFQIAFDQNSGDLYVASNGHVYHLDKNFSLLEQMSLGVGSGSNVTKQNVSILEIDNSYKYLLVCTLGGGGQCEFLSLKNITTRLRILSNDSKGSKVEVSENYRPIVHFLSKDNTSHVVVASPNDFTIQSFERPSEMSKPILSVRAISLIRDGFHMTYKTSLGPHPDFLQISKRKNSFYYDFINGFCYNDTCFYLTLQQENITSKTLVNRIACINSSSLFPYIDIPVGEYRDNRQQTYNRVVAMTLGKVGIGSETPVVVFVYGVAADVTSKDIDAAGGYTIRVIPLEKITEGIDTVIRLCLNRIPFVKLPDWYYDVSSDCTQVQWNVSQPRVMQGMRWDTIWSASLVIPGNASEMSNVTSVFTHTQPFLNGDPQIKLPGDMTIYVIMSSGRIYYFYNSWLSKSQVTIQFVNFTLLDGGGTHINRPVVKSDDVTSEEDYYILYGSKVLRRPLDYCENGASTSSGCNQIPGCVWCLKTKQCLLQAKCSVDESITIDSFEPRSGPWNGGTRITLRGSALSREDIRVKICGEKCSSPVYFQSDVMSCTVPPSTNNWTECAINVSSQDYITWTSLMDNETPFFIYTIPKVWKMEPNRMVKFDQGNITFRGEHLNTGSHVNIALGNGISCQVRHRRQDSIECQLSLSPTIESEHFVKEKKYKVNITIDNYVLSPSNLSDFFLYPEPNITSIYPNWTFYGGGVVMTVRGTNLATLNFPSLCLTLNNISGCHVKENETCTTCNNTTSNGTCLVCYAPNITNITSSTLTNTSAFVWLNMSASTKQPNFYSITNQRFISVNLEPDPVFDVLGSASVGNCRTIYDSRPELVLTGENFPNLSWMHVFLNQRKFSLINSSRTSLTLDLETIIRNFHSDKTNAVRKINITINIRQRTFDVGCIELVSSSSSNNSIIMYAAAGVGGTVFLFLLVMCCVLYVRLQKKKFQKKLLAQQSVSSVTILYPSPPGSGENTYVSLTQLLKLKMDQKRESDIQASGLIIDRKDLTLGNVIGKGNFGCVMEGYLQTSSTNPPELVAVKTLLDPVTHTIDLQGFIDEAFLMQKFHHDHVLGLIGLSEGDRGMPLVVLPYMNRGDLLTYVKDEKRDMTVGDVLRFSCDISSGMEYLSSLKFVHRDLAARNCMLDEQLRVKVADFGLCRDIYEKGYYHSDNKKKLPIRWMSIESIEKGTYTTKSDVWSFAVVIWELCTRGITPYPGVEGWDILRYLQTGRRLEQPVLCPDALYALMERCWNDNPGERPFFRDLESDLKNIIQGLTTPAATNAVCLATGIKFPECRRVRSDRSIMRKVVMAMHKMSEDLTPIPMRRELRPLLSKKKPVASGHPRTPDLSVPYRHSEGSNRKVAKTEPSIELQERPSVLGNGVEYLELLAELQARRSEIVPGDGYLQPSIERTALAKSDGDLEPSIEKRTALAKSDAYFCLENPPCPSSAASANSSAASLQHIAVGSAARLQHIAVGSAASLQHIAAANAASPT